MAGERIINRKEYPNMMVFDLETGGFSKDKHPLIEFAAIVVDNDFNELERKEWVVLPYNDELVYTPGAFKANGFTMGEIEKRGVDGAEVAKGIVGLLERHVKEAKIGLTISPNKKPVLAGHNITKFDIGFLEVFLKYYKYDLWKFVTKGGEIDTLDQARLFFGHPGYPYSDHKLGTCCNHIGFPIVDAHRAMNDAEGNLKLLKHFIESARGTRQVGVIQEERFRDTFKLS